MLSENFARCVPEWSIWQDRDGRNRWGIYSRGQKQFWFQFRDRTGRYEGKKCSRWQLREMMLWWWMVVVVGFVPNNAWSSIHHRTIKMCFCGLLSYDVLVAASPGILHSENGQVLTWSLPFASLSLSCLTVCCRHCCWWIDWLWRCRAVRGLRVELAFVSDRYWIIWREDWVLRGLIYVFWSSNWWEWRSFFWYWIF